MLSIYFIDAIQKNLKVAGDLCEIGVYKAKSVVMLSRLAAEHERVFGYDLFPDDLETDARANLDRFGRPERCVLIKGDSAEISAEEVGDTLAAGVRLLHIDAGHEYHEVFHQLLLFAPFVKQGGVIIMDDYQDREFPGIEAAVLDFSEILKPRRFVPFFSGGNKMYLCDPAVASDYQRALLMAGFLKDRCRVTRVRDFVVVVALSKLPMSSETCLRQIEALAFPAHYQEDLAGAARAAHTFAQNRFGSEQS